MGWAEIWAGFAEWSQSSGFAGTAALIAALVAYGAARHRAGLNAWWQRAEWALDKYTSRDSTPQEREVGASALEALQRSNLGSKREQEFLTAVVDATTLDLDGDGLETDDLVDDPATDEGYSEQTEERSHHD